jgi:ferredoxin-NADP reductase
VVEVRPETSEAKTIVLDVPDWPGHLAGQHVDVRLTAGDGYQAQRSYSIASPPEDQHLALTVERIDDGEVSLYLCDELRTGDLLELRGPIGGYFTWQAADGGPLLLLAGGSGVVPLTAMLRHRAAQASPVDARLLVSAGTRDDILYRHELDQFGRDGVAVHYTLTRVAPPDWRGWSRRVDTEMLQAIGPEPQDRPLAFVCGPTPFVEHVANVMVGLGHDPRLVKTERFGPTGG